MGAGPSLQHRVCASPKRRVTPVKVVAARVVAQVLPLTFIWACRCSFRKTTLASRWLLRLSLSLPLLLLSSLALPLLVPVLWLVRRLVQCGIGLQGSRRPIGLLTSLQSSYVVQSELGLSRVLQK